MPAKNAYESLKKFLSLSAGRGGPIANTIDSFEKTFEKRYASTSFPSEEEKYQKIIKLVVDGNALGLEGPLSNSIKTVFNNYPNRNWVENLLPYNEKAYFHATKVLENAAKVAAKTTNLNEGPVDQIAANVARIVDQSQKNAMGASEATPTAQPSPSPSPSPTAGVPAAMPDGTATAAPTAPASATAVATPAPTPVAAKKSPYSFDAETQKVWDDALAAPTMTEARRKLANLELTAANESINNSSIDVFGYQQQLKNLQDEWTKKGKDPSQLEATDVVKELRRNIASANAELQKKIQERNKVFKEYASGEVKDPSIVSEGIRTAKGGGLVYVTVRRNADGTLVATGSYVQPDGAGGVKKTSPEVPVTINPDGTAEPATEVAPQSARGTSASAPAAFPSSADDTEDDFSDVAGGSSSGGSSGGKWIDVPTGEVGPGMVPITKKVWQPGAPSAPPNLVHYIDDKTGTMYWFNPKTGVPVGQVQIPRTKESAKIIKTIEMPDGGVVLYYDDGEKEIIDAPEEVKNQKKEAADADRRYKEAQSGVAEQSIRSSKIKQIVSDLVREGKYTPQEGALLIGDFDTYLKYQDQARRDYEASRSQRVAEKQKALERVADLQSGYELSSMLFGGGKGNAANAAKIAAMVAGLPGGANESVGARLYRKEYGQETTPLDYKDPGEYKAPEYSPSSAFQGSLLQEYAKRYEAQPSVPAAIPTGAPPSTPERYIYNTDPNSEEMVNNYRSYEYSAPPFPKAIGRFGQ